MKNSSLVHRMAWTAAVIPAVLTLLIISTAVVRLGFQGTGLSVRNAWIYLGFVGAAAIAAGALTGVVFAKRMRRKLERIGHLLDSMGNPDASTGPDSTGGGASDTADRLSLAAKRFEQRHRQERAEYREKAEKARIRNENRKAFLDALSSELGGPLDRIMKMADGLMSGEQGELTKNQVEDLRIIRQACRRLHNMVTDVQDLSSLMAKGIEYDSEPVNLRDVANEVVEAARAELGKKNLRLFVKKGGEPPLVRGSRKGLKQVMEKLVANGIKHTAEGEIAVRLDRTDGGKALIEVSDTGAGIPSENLDDVFDPFRQPGEKSKRMKGYGLGLAICKLVVELHKGEIRVSSIEGQGSRFTATLWSRQ